MMLFCVCVFILDFEGGGCRDESFVGVDGLGDEV